MHRRLRLSAAIFTSALLLPSSPLFANAQAAQTPPAPGQSKANIDKDKPLPATKVQNAVLWTDPGNIAEKDLFFGRGGRDHQPKPPFTFLSEDHNGTNPKFDVRDANDKKWRVKLASEARPEVVASRLLWAVGYFADEDYLLPSAQVPGAHLSRGENLIHNGTVTDARFARKPGDEKKIAVWRWKSNPFKGTREFNGLRVMMAVMNNWDLKDVNNAVYRDDKHDRQIFLVSDLGATFATNDEHVHHNVHVNHGDADKGNLASYEHSKFITKKTDEDVSFATPLLPVALVVHEGPQLIPEVFRRSAIDWIGHDIPIADARWMGGLLGQLTHQQLVDAFRAGNFPDDQVDQFVTIVQARIDELKAL